MSIKKSHKNNKKDIDKIVCATYNSHINNKRNTKTNNQPGGRNNGKESNFRINRGVGEREAWESLAKEQNETIENILKILQGARIGS